MESNIIGRRAALALGGAAAASMAAGRAMAQAPSEVKIAMLVPLSGPWAREGILEKMGAEMAVDDVNKAGGIKSLGGAKLSLLQYDAQDSAEKAKDAAQRMIAEHPDLSGGFGCWLSTFTLAATEVTERAKLPWFTLSYSDAITGRGFHYVFQTAATGVQQAEDTVPLVMRVAEAAGPRPTKVAFIGDNTAATVSFRKPLLSHVFKDQHLTLVLDKTYTPPLSDATTLVQPVRGARPDFVLLRLHQRRRRQDAGRYVRAVWDAGFAPAADRQWRALGDAGTAEDDRGRQSAGNHGRAGELAGQGSGGFVEALHRPHRGEVVRPRLRSSPTAT